MHRGEYPTSRSPIRDRETLQTNARGFMKVEMLANGTLFIKSETIIEAYALESWLERNGRAKEPAFNGMMMFSTAIEEEP